MVQGTPRGLERTCCRRSYIRGLFQCCGSVTNPEKAYHLEWTLKEESLCQDLLALLEKEEISAHAVQRKNAYVAYIKEGDGVAEVLAMMGANSAILQMENARIVRQMRNKANRAMNCDTANINKTMSAAAQRYLWAGAFLFGIARAWHSCAKGSQCADHTHSQGNGPAVGCYQ